MVRLALDYGADVNDVTNTGRSGLFHASAKGHLKIVDILLGAKARHSEDENGNHPLHLAASMGFAGVVERLVEKGASLDERNNAGQTALLMAAAGAKNGVVKALLEAGANVSLADDGGRTALMEAAATGQLESMGMLAAKGADVNAADNEGVTALMRAAGADRKDALTLLLSLGARVMILSNKGKAADHYAKSEAVRNLLRDWEAKALAEYTGGEAVDAGGLERMLSEARRGLPQGLRQGMLKGPDQGALGQEGAESGQTGLMLEGESRVVGPDEAGDAVENGGGEVSERVLMARKGTVAFQAVREDGTVMTLGLKSVSDASLLALDCAREGDVLSIRTDGSGMVVSVENETVAAMRAGSGNAQPMLSAKRGPRPQ